MAVSLQKLCRVGAGGGILLIAGTAGLYFSPWAVLLILLVSGLTWLRPAWGVSLLFVVVSVDPAGPVLGNIVVNFSELLFAGCLIAWATTTRLSRIKWDALKWGLPFLSAVLLSGAIQIEWYKVIPHLIRSSELILCLFLAMNVYREVESRISLRWALGAAAVFYSLAGFLLYEEIFRTRSSSFFSNPNQFGGYLGLLGPFFLVLMLLRRERWAAPSLLLFSLVLISQLGTGSRSALLGLLTATAFILLSSHRKAYAGAIAPPLVLFSKLVRASPRLRGGLLLVAAAALLIVLTPAGRFVKDSVSGMASRTSDSIEGLSRTRIPLFFLGTEVFKDHWLIGVGPGRWKELVPGYLERFDDYDWGGDRDQARRYAERHVYTHAHNLYLQLAADFGLLGLVAFLFQFFCVWGHLWSQKDPWALAGLGIVVAFAVQNLLDSTYPSLALETGLLLGVACSAVGAHGPAQGRNRAEQLA